jgi:uncharacterized iron-regulated protein
MLMTRWLITLAAVAIPALVGASSSSSCSRHASEARWQEPRTVGAQSDFASLIQHLATHRVVFIGEAHDRYDHHLTQLEIICRLAQQGRPVAIAMEAFQQPFQGALERYVTRHRDLDRMLLETEYFMRWGFDARLYAPILQFAASRGIPLVALNASTEMVAQVSRDGPQGLSGQQAVDLTRAVEQAPDAYVERLRTVFRSHPGFEKRSFDHFLAVQLLWDEHMARRASAWLSTRPGHRLIVLAGGGHVEHDDAIPRRMRGVDSDDMVIVAQTQQREEAEASPRRHELRNHPITLPEPGRLGVILDRRSGRVLVGGFGEISAGRDAGLLVGDGFTSIDGRSIDSVADLRLALWQRRPGDAVDLVLDRDGTSVSMRFALR